MNVAQTPGRTQARRWSAALLRLSAPLVFGGSRVTTALARTMWAEDSEARRYERFWPPSPFLDPEVRGRSPAEEWFVFADHQIHLDRLPGTTGTDTTVVLVHGGAGHGRLLLPFALPLWARGFEVVAPDLPNYGRSIPGAERITLDVWVRILSALVDQEHARGRRVVLYGLSIGGMTSYHVAAENPKVAAVVATTLLDLREGDARDAAASSRFMSRVVSPLGRALPWLFDGLMLRAGAVGRLEGMSPMRDLVDALDEDPRIGRVRMPAAFYRTLSERSPSREPEQFTTPILLVHPGHDLWTPLALSRPFFDRIAGPRQIRVLGGGAHIPLEQPAFDELQRTVLAFLASLEDGPTDLAEP